jgi:hypothetical protein
MGLGIVTNVAQGVRAASTPQNGDRGPTEAGSLPKLLDDDAAAAIHSDRGDEESDVRQNAVDTRAAALGQSLREFTASFTKGLAEYEELSQEVADGRFSPKALREQIEASANAAGKPGEDARSAAPWRDSASAFSSLEDSDSLEMSKRDLRALAWLRDKAQQALSSQKNVEPGRVLLLLRGMIHANASKPDRQETVAPAEEAVLAQKPENE